MQHLIHLSRLFSILVCIKTENQVFLSIKAGLQDVISGQSNSDHGSSNATLTAKFNDYLDSDGVVVQQEKREMRRVVNQIETLFIPKACMPYWSRRSVQPTIKIANCWRYDRPLSSNTAGPRG